MNSKTLLSLILLVSLLIIGCNSDKTNPKVIGTFPETGDQNVDPDTKEIWVKFNEPMMDKSWAWSYFDKSKFPETSGNPTYTEGNTKCILPVKLMPNQEYDIWINTEKLQSFMDKAGNGAVPFEMKFKTR